MRCSSEVMQATIRVNARCRDGEKLREAIKTRARARLISACTRLRLAAAATAGPAGPRVRTGDVPAAAAGLGSSRVSEPGPAPERARVLVPVPAPALERARAPEPAHGHARDAPELVRSPPPKLRRRTRSPRGCAAALTARVLARRVRPSDPEVHTPRRHPRRRSLRHFQPPILRRHLPEARESAAAAAAADSARAPASD